MRNKIIPVLICASFFFAAAIRPAQAVTLSDFELTAVVQVVSYNEGEEYYYTGTGYMVDFISGCFVTAAHVILDENNTNRENNLVIFQPGTPEEETYWVTPIVSYTDTDVAFVCVDDENFVPAFRHYFTFGQDTFDSLQVGDELTGIGYPSLGGDTITAVFGNLSGFLPYVGDKDLIKMDMDVSAGISGGPVIAENKDLVGMVVAYSGEDGAGISYAVSADLLNYVDDVASEYIIDALVASGAVKIPEGCVESETEGFYTMGDETYYDFYCSQKRDEAKELVVKTQYEHWCNSSADDEYAVTAAQALNMYNDRLKLDDWRAYLGQLCGNLSPEDPYNFYTPNQDMHARLMKRADLSAVYAVLNDGKRHVFPNLDVFASWYGEDFSTIETVSPEALADYILGSNVTFHPGTLIKIPSIPKVYLVSDENELRWITDEKTAEVLYGSLWNTKVFDVSESLYKNYSLGADITL